MVVSVGETGFSLINLFTQKMEQYLSTVPFFVLVLLYTLHVGTFIDLSLNQNFLIQSYRAMHGLHLLTLYSLIDFLVHLPLEIL